MTLEINPVLAGTYDLASYAPPTPAASTQAGDTDLIDTRRYTKFDRSAADAGSTTTYSFSDFLDMINPLQHIPVLSSIYREITGESIHPVSRVAGDILYGGALGVASAVMGGLGAAGDALVEAQTGKDTTGNMVAALFDSPDTPPAAIQLAQASGTSSQSPASAQNQVLASSAAIPNSPLIPLAGLKTPVKQVADASSANAQAQTQALLAAKAFPVDPQKMPFGGVMDPSSLQGTNMALAMAAHAPGLQIGNTVYPGRLMPGIRHTAVGMPAPAITAPSGLAVASASSSTETSLTATPAFQAPLSSSDPLPPALMQDLASLRAINKYKNTANQSAPSGSNIDVVN